MRSLTRLRWVGPYRPILHASACRSQYGRNQTRMPWLRTSNGERLLFTKTLPDKFSQDSVPADRAYIALGSNVGDRFAHMERACAALDAAGLRVLRTSSLYESAPMYVTDQAAFLNGACEVAVPPGMSPMDLLAQLKRIEDQLGRVKTVDKGPRCIDLDILLHGDAIVNSSLLTVPHASMLEREFVLRPLADLVPAARYPVTAALSTSSAASAGSTAHPSAALTYTERLLALSASAPQHMPPLVQPSPRFAGGPLRPMDPTRRTHVMAILNVTPDSFSDGGVHAVGSPNTLLDVVRAAHAAGAGTLDVGGQSTRPHAPPVPAEEEIARVVPVIQAVRSDASLDGLTVSIDTYRAEVAAAAVAAGADIVNDVSAGTLDPQMLRTVARLGCGIVLMHMRGNPESMNSLTDYDSQGGVVRGVASELRERVEAALAAGVRRWRIVLDPGIGFAKTAAQNLELLRSLAELRDAPGLHGLPWLVGSSRKSFVGKITGVKEPRDRLWGTASTVAAAVQGGADIIRVHDVPEMAQVARMADAIWRDRR